MTRHREMVDGLLWRLGPMRVHRARFFLAAEVRDHRTILHSVNWLDVDPMLGRSPAEQGSGVFGVFFSRWEEVLSRAHSTEADRCDGWELGHLGDLTDQRVDFAAEFHQVTGYLVS